MYPTADALARAVAVDTPRGDPYSEKGAERFALVAMILGVPVGAVGMVLLLLTHRRRVRLAG